MDETNNRMTTLANNYAAANEAILYANYDLAEVIRQSFEAGFLAGRVETLEQVLADTRKFNEYLRGIMPK